MMESVTYSARRSEIQTYFDRTAAEAWKRFASDAPLGRIRESVREGRARMRGRMLECLPSDLTGWRILDAGCGTGAMSVALARRGASVVGVDLAPEIIRFAEDTLPPDLRDGQIEFRAGDMLSDRLGTFDAVVAMDSLIHYQSSDAVAALARLAARSLDRIVFTFAPGTPALLAMHRIGQFFPRSNRSPAIVPVRPADMAERVDAALQGWAVRSTERVAHGFYTSQMMELVRR
jgi:magnesium-protoporphyrin O-methyltransferase